MSKSPFKLPGFSGFGNTKPIKTNTNTTDTMPDPNESIEEKINRKTEEKVDEKVEEVVNQKSGEGLTI